MNAEILALWWAAYGHLLLAKNIRFFKGSTEANEGMRKTLLNDLHSDKPRPDVLRGEIATIIAEIEGDYNE